MASPKAALLLLATALLVSCCYASRSAILATGGEMEEKAVIQSDPAKCVVMKEQCDEDKCTQYCVEQLHLGTKKGFCSFYNMDFRCCCPITEYDPPAATKIPASSTSAKQV